MRNQQRKIRHLVRTPLCAALLAATAMPVGAVEEFAMDGQDYLSELPVVLTVSRLPQSKSELPMAVTVIDREMIEASGAVRIADLFRLVAGFQVGHYHDSDGPRDVVTYHGSTDQYSRRMQVLVDGRSVYTWGTGGVEWGDLPLSMDDIERIEVSRGPNGVTYGSNAFLGVINIITRHSREQKGASVRVTTDDDAYRNIGLRYAAGSGDLSYRISGGFRTDDGYDDYLDPSGTLYELNDDSETANVDFRGDFRAGVNDYWTLQLGGSSSRQEVGFSDDPLDPVRERQVGAHYQQLRWKRLFDSDTEINAQFYHNLHDVDDRFETGMLSEVYTDIFTEDCVPEATLPECALYPFDAADLALMGMTDESMLRDTSIKSERYDLELSYRFRLAESLRMVWGGEVRLDEVTAADYFDTGSSYRNRLSRLFFNGEWRPAEGWVINAGDMLEDSSSLGSRHSPRLAINKQVGQRGYVRASTGRAYRIPTALEKEAHFTIRFADGSLFHDLYNSAAGLEEERIDSSELAFGSASDEAEYEIKLFHDKVASEIDAATNQDPSYPPPHWTISNVGEHSVEGAELQLKVKGDERMLSVAYAYANVYGSRLKRINPDFFTDVSNSVPNHTLNLLLVQRLPGGYVAGMNYSAVSDMRYHSGDDTGGMQSLDITLSKALRLSRNKLKIQLALKNLLGSYHDYEEETVSTRRAFVTVKMDF